MKEKANIALIIVAFFITLFVLFVPDWHNFLRPNIGHSDKPIGSFEGIKLGDSLSTVYPLLQANHPVGLDSTVYISHYDGDKVITVTIEDSVFYYGIQFFDVELVFFHGILEYMTFTDDGTGMSMRKKFSSFQDSLIAKHSERKYSLQRNTDVYVSNHHDIIEEGITTNDYLSATLKFNKHLKLKGWKYRETRKEKYYGVIEVRVYRRQYPLHEVEK